MRTVLFTLFIILSGCVTSRGPDVVLIESNNYEYAFNVAIEAAKSHGLAPVLLDRRMGTISTQPTIAGSIVEPWKPQASTPLQALENTLSYQRRTARFEFKPTQQDPVEMDDDQELFGPNLLAPAKTDLTAYKGLIELRVWVFVDRHHNQGIRLGSSSLRSESVAKTLPREEPWEQVQGSFWTPETRDVAKERSLLATIELAMQAQESDFSGK